MLFHSYCYHFMLEVGYVVVAYQFTKKEHSPMANGSHVLLYNLRHRTSAATTTKAPVASTTGH